METYGELLATVLFADIAHAAVELLPASQRFAAKVFEVMELLLALGAPEVNDLVVTGFLEGLPRGSEADPKVLALVGPRTRKALEALSQ
jgi:hypothetical protein